MLRHGDGQDHGKYAILKSPRHETKSQLLGLYRRAMREITKRNTSRD